MKKLFLVFVVIAIVSSSVQAKYSGGSGDANDPYQIGSATDLLTLAGSTGDYNANFILIADIDLASYTFTTAVIAPYIYNPDDGYFHGVPFIGVFDGNGHKITNLFINITNDYGGDYLGLFGYLNYGEIKNLGVGNVNITSLQGSSIGGLTGENSCGIIINCHSSGAINIVYNPTVCPAPTSICLGGLIGYNNYGKINSCSSSVSINGGHNTHSLGGLAGYNYYGDINNSFATGNVTGVSSFNSFGMDFGGLVGGNYNGIISQCWASGNVSGDAEQNARGNCCFGGLVGLNYYGGTISNCYATGSVSVTSGIRGGYIGGLIGENGDYDSSATNCYSTGAVIGNPYIVYGGLVGENSIGTVTASFWDMDTSGLTFSDGGEGKTTAEMKTESTFTDAGWDFVGETANGTEDIWWIIEN
ncbi:MAG: GLUG motif-containing protein, partial [Sedimentisphaerales bacterium]